MVADSTWTPSFPQLALEGGGGPWRLGTGDCSSFELTLAFLSPLPMSLCVPPTRDCLCLAHPTVPHSLSASPGVSASPSVCLCLRRMSRLAVCWRRWVWHSPPALPPAWASWRHGELVERQGMSAPFLGGTQLPLLCCLTFFWSELWAQDPQTFLPSPLSPFPLSPAKVLGARR